MKAGEAVFLATGSQIILPITVTRTEGMNKKLLFWDSLEEFPISQSVLSQFT
jgi:hypothetical protein